MITLPCYPGSFFSNHFKMRNLLAHVRCDVRQGGNREKVLLLQEVQSDWAQQARREFQRSDGGRQRIAAPPFLAEWPALVLKLVLLHAAHGGMDAVAWTRGAHQVHRYNGLGEDGLRELYDRTLPREANRMLTPFRIGSGSVEVYVPENFGIRRIEEGYEVRTAGGRRLGVAPTMVEARDLLPDGAHEWLWSVHGVRLDEAMRQSIRQRGFMAWG